MVGLREYFNILGRIADLCPPDEPDEMTFRGHNIDKFFRQPFRLRQLLAALETLRCYHGFYTGVAEGIQLAIDEIGKKQHEATADEERSFLHRALDRMKEQDFPRGRKD